MTMNCPHKILIIDDTPEDIETVKRLLSESDEEDYMICGADNGERGLNAMKMETFDCVFVDYMLPDCDGTELIRIIRNNPDTQYVSLILLSAYGTGPRAAAALKSGA